MTDVGRPGRGPVGILVDRAGHRVANIFGICILAVARAERDALDDERKSPTPLGQPFCVPRYRWDLNSLSHMRLRQLPRDCRDFHHRSTPFQSMRWFSFVVTLLSRPMSPSASPR